MKYELIGFLMAVGIAVVALVISLAIAQAIADSSMPAMMKWWLLK